MSRNVCVTSSSGCPTLVESGPKTDRQSWRENAPRAEFEFPAFSTMMNDGFFLVGRCCLYVATHVSYRYTRIVVAVTERPQSFLRSNSLRYPLTIARRKLLDSTRKMNVVPSSTGRSSTPLSTSKSKRRTESGLNFYTEPPTVELSIDDFEVFALKRLKVSL